MFFQIVAVVGVGVGFKMMQGKQQFELDPAAPWVGDCADKYLRIVLWAHLVATIGVCLVPLFGWFGFPVIAVRLPRALLQLPFRLGCALASSRPESAAQSIYSTGWPLSDGCLVLSCLAAWVQLWGMVYYPGAIMHNNKRMVICEHRQTDRHHIDISSRHSPEHANDPPCPEWCFARFVFGFTAARCCVWSASADTVFQFLGLLWWFFGCVYAFAIAW